MLDAHDLQALAQQRKFSSNTLTRSKPCLGPYGVNQCCQEKRESSKANLRG